MGTHPIFESDFDCLTDMKAVEKYDKLVIQYLKRTGRTKTLEELKKSLKKKESDERKPVKLSFAIQKAPERLKEKLEPVKKPLKLKEEKKALVIPRKFIKLAKKFGLPEQHLEFFYENKDSFNWETKDKTEILCSDAHCKFKTKATPGCFLEHMKTVHNYADIPCDKADCSFIAFSSENFARHKANFHGHGRKPTEYGNHPCPYSCKVSFRKPSGLLKHINVHKNRVFSCSYCQYRNTNMRDLQWHLRVHFDIKNYTCDICSRSFTNNDKLTIHKLNVHSTDDFLCIDCGFVAPKLKALRVHRSSCKERLKHSRILRNF